MTFRTFTDQLNRQVAIPFPPRRIVSLVPSQTELLVDLGLENEIVGITKFCVHPEGLRKKKTLVGGTKNFNLDRIEELDPDLIIGNKEENYQEGVAWLESRFPVWMSDVENLDDAFAMINGIGLITGKQVEAQRIVEKIKTNFSAWEKPGRASVLYLIWKKPWMVAGSNTFIDTMLAAAGFQNCIRDTRYPTLTDEQLRQLNPAFVFLSSEPYPFKERHMQEIKDLMPNSKIILVDGEMFSWYGSRLMHTSAYFRKLSLSLY